MKKTLLFSTILVLFFQQASHAETSQHRPTLVIRATTGENIWDLSKMRGKIVLINFWVSWCSECKREMQILNEIYDEYKVRGLEIIGVSVDNKRSAKKAAEVARDIQYPLGMFFNIKESSFEYPATVPISYLIDQTGELYSIFGEDGEVVSKEDFIEVIESLI